MKPNLAKALFLSTLFTVCPLSPLLAQGNPSGPAVVLSEQDKRDARHRSIAHQTIHWLGDVFSELDDPDSPSFRDHPQVRAAIQRLRDDILALMDPHGTSIAADDKLFDPQMFFGAAEIAATQVEEVTLREDRKSIRDKRYNHEYRLLAQPVLSFERQTPTGPKTFKATIYTIYNYLPRDDAPNGLMQRPAKDWFEAVESPGPILKSLADMQEPEGKKIKDIQEAVVGFLVVEGEGKKTIHPMYKSETAPPDTRGADEQ